MNIKIVSDDEMRQLEETGFIGTYESTGVYETRNDRIYFAKLRKEATIPSKETENAGYDIRACFDGDCIAIKPGEIELVPTGLCSAFSEDYVMVLKERGSTGTKGLSQRCGIIDSGFRGEWFVPINNTTNKIIIITKYPEDTQSMYGKGIVTIFPYTKSICQALLLPVPKTEIIELTATEIKRVQSNRGSKCLGSSGK